MKLYCSGCDQHLDENEFHRDRSRISGRVTRCKACTSIRKAAAHARLAARSDEEIDKGPAEIWCPGCKQTLPRDDFAVARMRKTGRKSACHTCDSARQRRYRRERKQARD